MTVDVGLWRRDEVVVMPFQYVRQGFSVHVSSRSREPAAAKNTSESSLSQSVSLSLAISTSQPNFTLSVAITHLSLCSPLAFYSVLCAVAVALVPRPFVAVLRFFVHECLRTACRFVCIWKCRAESPREISLTMSSRSQYDSVIDDDDELWYVWPVVSHHGLLLGTPLTSPQSSLHRRV